MAAVELRIKDVAIFVDGAELEGVKELSFSPKDSDNVKGIQDWTGKTVAISIKENYDFEGSITLLSSSKNNSQLMSIASAKKAVQIVISSKDPKVTGFKSISMDQAYFFFPEVKPSADEPQLEWKFWGTGYKME
ncbi:MAG: hypothetical protein QXV61_00170 [Archaeoglobaceae archaeon]